MMTSPDPAQRPRQMMTPTEVDTAMRAMNPPPAGARPDPVAPAIRAAHIEARIAGVLAANGVNPGFGTRPPTPQGMAVYYNRLVTELRAEFDTLAAQGYLPGGGR